MAKKNIDTSLYQIGGRFAMTHHDIDLLTGMVIMAIWAYFIGPNLVKAGRDIRGMFREEKRREAA